jgi:hypothetical protein
MIFVLPHRLSQGLPTAVQYTDKIFVLFTDQGPTEHPGDVSFHFPDHTWALTDASSGTATPCFAFRTRPPDIFLLQTTSPLVSRYKEWRKQRRGVKMYVMECVTLSELKAIGCVSSFLPALVVPLTTIPAHSIHSYDVDMLVEYYVDRVLLRAHASS